VGGAIGGGLDLVSQLSRNGGRLGCLNYGELGLAIAGGAFIGGGLALLPELLALEEEAGAAVAVDGVWEAAGYEIGGSTQLVGDTYVVNIWGLYSTPQSEGIFALANTIRAEATAAGASNISITGAYIRNPMIYSLGNALARRFGLSFSRIGPNAIRLWGPLR
jgi:hypothetical protein